ncbi:MAG: RecX family transcriptional regulator [Bacteroidales bacterium]|jgi:regulatory protein|nr:RecX family transcriptional regulator [Bacteroidales bacterium]
MMTTHDHQILDKARQFCDYQERCIHDVKEKLQSWQIVPEQIERIIVALQEENYLDEDRYVRAFALGKLRHNKWGKIKIMYALKQKRIPEMVIEIGLQELDSDEYLQTLQHLLQTKKVKAADSYTQKAKLAQFAIQKGFESALVWQILKQKD